MASASARMLTQGWSGEQRRALMAVLTSHQRGVVIDRIDLEFRENRIEQEEQYETKLYVNTLGEKGASYGLPEWIAATLFGVDPKFRDEWQRIRRMHDNSEPLPERRPLVMGMDIAARLHGKAKRTKHLAARGATK